MWGFLSKRLNEGSTYAGLAAVALGVGQAFKVDEAQGVADALGQMAQHTVAGGDVVTGGIVALFGVLAAVWKDKG